MITSSLGFESDDFYELVSLVDIYSAQSYII